MKFGYVRVSKSDQNQELQLGATRAMGCKKIFHKKISGATKHRTEFERMQEQLCLGDGVVVFKHF